MTKPVGWLLALCGVVLCLLGLAYAMLFLFICAFPPCGSGVAARQAERWLPILLLIGAGGIYYLLACAGIVAWRWFATKVVLVLAVVASLVVAIASFRGNADYTFLLIPGGFVFSSLGVLLFRFGTRIAPR